MKHLASAVLLLCVASASAQYHTKTDIIGAHINSGHACSACHAPHSVTVRGEAPLWGDITTPFIQKEQDGIRICVSCHDGNYAPKAMMKDGIYEELPDGYPKLDSIPTFQEAATKFGPQFTSHPIGLEAQLGCGGPNMWDCVMKDGARIMSGLHAAKFAANYGFFNEAHTIDGKNVVVCTTCHSPHSMNVTRVTKKKQSNAYPAGTYATRFFLRAPYNHQGAPNSGNMSAQYCRQCHADKSNEMNGGTISSFGL
jgi:formate-dependent nitrite reductase cytochrome c552 subunit